MSEVVFHGSNLTCSCIYN